MRARARALCWCHTAVWALVAGLALADPPASGLRHPVAVGGGGGTVADIVGPRVVTTASMIRMDMPIWESWTNGASHIGATSLTSVSASDTLYISDGGAWLNIVWTKVQTGDHIQIKSFDGVTLLQNWTVTSPYVVQSPGGHIAVQVVTGGPLLVPAQGSLAQCFWIH